MDQTWYERKGTLITVVLILGIIGIATFSMNRSGTITGLAIKDIRPECKPAMEQVAKQLQDSNIRLNTLQREYNKISEEEALLERQIRDEQIKTQALQESFTAKQLECSP